MGACGCSEGSFDYTLPGPVGTTYGLTIYTGCDYCDAPAGIGIDLVDDGDIMLEGCGPPLLAAGQTMGGVPVIGGEQLLLALREIGAKIAEHELDDDSFAPHEQYGVIRAAVHATAEAYRRTRSTTT